MNRPRTPFRPDLVLWLSFAACFAAMLFQTFRFAPATFHRPSTVVSNGDAKFFEPLLVFLSEVSEWVPEGATFSLVPPDGHDPVNWLDYAVAVGQMRGRRVILAIRFLPTGSGGETPRFVACYGGTFTDSRFRRVRRFRGGDLYEAAR
jgi:hypothetical protein